MERIARAWDIAQRSWGVLAEERALLVVAVLAHLAALLAATVVFFAGLAVVELQAAVDPGTASWFVVAAAALAGAWLASSGQGAVIAGAAERMDGGHPTVGSALAAVRGRIGPLFVWALISTVVGRLLDLLRRRRGAAGRTAGSGGRFAFKVVTFLALPVIVLEGAGAVQSLKRSWELLKSTWGENVSFNVGLQLLAIVLLAPAAALVAVAAWAGLTPLPFLAFLPLVLYGVVVVGSIAALSAVFKVALYRWATDAPVDAAFDRQQLAAAFGER
jgi:hypothetical protein